MQTPAKCELRISVSNNRYLICSLPVSGIQPLPSGPPRALTLSLGREVEKFDQLCDAMESHLVRMARKYAFTYN